MGMLNGTTGLVALASGQFDTIADLNVHAWSGSFDSAIHVRGVFGETGGKQSFKDTYVFTGTISCYHDDTVLIDAADLQADGVVAAITLTAVTGQTYAFNAHIGNVAINVDFEGGPPTLEFSFTSTGDVTPA